MNDTGFSSTDNWVFDHLGALGTGVVVLVVAVFALVLGAILWRVTRYASATPQSAPAQCIGKRTEIRGGGDTQAHTRYYATFELADGTRKELSVGPRKIGLIQEGDRGEVRWRDTVMQDFVRDTGSAARPVS